MLTRRRAPEAPTMLPTPGLGETCLGCHTTLALPNIPTPIQRDGAHWGYTHNACAAPFLTRMLILNSDHFYMTGN